MGKQPKNPSDKEDLIEPLPLGEAKKLAQNLLRHGVYSFSTHADDELAKDQMQRADVINIVRGGQCTGSEFRDETWRYTFRTNTMAAIVAFRSATEMRFVTAWRDKKRKGEWKK